MIEWVEQLRADFTAEFGTRPKVMTLASVDVNERPPRPHCRSVVCRWLGNDGSMLIAVDARSAKCPQLADRGAAEVCAWLPGLRRQFRMYCEATVLHGRGGDDPRGLREQIWAELSESARALFFWPQPGAPRETRDDAFPPAVRTGLPPDSFALISLVPVDVDLLELSEHPHRRRRWCDEGDGWLVREINP